jgi:hypothetical protein
MGHLDNPVTPLNDFQYGQPDYLLYDTWDNTTDNNLYNKYYQRYVSQIENGKLLVAKFKLTPSDILNLDFRNKVWIHDSYWFVNKITDYNANKEQLTTVELINVEDGTSFEPVQIARKNFPIKIQGALLNFIHNLGNEATKDERNIFGERTANITVNGFDNIIQAGTINSILVGDGNSLAGKDSMVIGTNNTIEGNNIIAIGVSGQTLNNNDTITLGLPVVATTISADTLFIGGSPTPIEPSPFIAGSAGLNNAVQFGSLADATGDYSFASGQDTVASGFGSNASNIGTSATGLGSHAEGSNTVASANYTHAEGEGTVAQGQNSHAQGKGSNAVGFYSHAGGNYSRASYDGEISSNGIASSTVGRTQFGILNSIGFTTNATPTLLDFDNGAIAQNGFTPPFAVVSANDLAMSFTYQIVCFRASNGTARIITGEGLIKWITGVPTLVYASTPSVNGDIGLLGVTATPVASGFGLQFQITGIAASNLRWTLRMDYNW